MFVKKVTLHNFRNYAEKTVCFTQGLNVIMGPNATGKTNLLESVYMCGLGGSPRVSRDKDVILWGEKGAYIHLELQKKFRAHTIDMYIDSREKKRVAIDGIPISRLSQLIGTLGIVFFSPDELKLVKDALRNGAGSWTFRSRSSPLLICLRSRVITPCWRGATSCSKRSLPAKI